MALYTERKYSDIAADWEDMQRRQLQRQQEEAMNRYNAVQNKVNQAQQGPSNPLESVLSGIGNSIKNVGTSLVDLFGTGGAAFGDAIESIKTGKVTTKNQDDFRKWLYKTDDIKDAATKGLGTGLDAAATLTDFVPGLGTGAKVALNMGQGVASGIANPLIEKGSQATLEDAMKGAVVGGASAGVGQYVGGKLANRAAGKGIVSKALNSNIGKGAITGGLAGATGGGLYAGLNGGDVLSGAMQGAQSGALAGGTMAGTMGLVGSGIDRLNNRVNRNTPTTPQATVDDVTPMQKPIVEQVAEQYTRTPAQRRNIDVQYADDAGTGVNVARSNRNQYRLPDRSGSTLDGVLGPNNPRKLPNAEVDTSARFNDLFGNKKINNLSDAIASGELDFEGNDALKGILTEILPENTMERLKDGASDYNNSVTTAHLDAYGLDGKNGLPMLNREQYYKDNMGQLAANGGNGAIRAEDVEDYMYNHLRNDAGKNALGGSQTDNWTIMRELFGNKADDWDLDRMYDEYRMLARAENANRPYSNQNLLGALALDDQLNAQATREFLEDSYPTRRIDVNKQAPLAENVDINAPSRGQLIQDITPGRRQAQAQPAIQETPAQAPVQRVRRAADTSDVKIDPNLSPEDVARLERQLTVSRQKQGAALLEQYGTLDAPVRRAVGSPEDVLTTLYDDYGLKTPADVQYAANHVTGRDGVVSKMTRELAASADSVDTTITRDWLQDLMDSNGLLDDEQKTVTKQIAGALKRANTNSDGATTLDIMKQLEKQSARYKGKDGTYHHATEAETRKGIILDLVHDELQDRLWDAAGDPKKVLTPKRLTELKNMYKDNDAWAKFIDNRLAKSTSGAELRSAMKPLVDGSKIVYGSKQSAGGFADRAYKAATSANPIVAMGQMAYDAALDSSKAKQARASKYAKDAAKAKAQLTGQDAPKASSGKGIGTRISNAASALNNDTFSNARLGGNVGDAYNMPSFGEIATRQLSRQAGLNAMRDQDRQAQVQSGMQEMQNITNEYNNAVQQAQQAQQAYAQSMQRQNSGTDTLNRISLGMERALAAGDINAYSKLADLYQQAYKIYGLQNPEATKNETKALSGNQSKALTGLQQLQTLSGMTPSLSTALANSPVSGIVDMFGGDDYANQAKGLALTLGYLQSGANITPREAENIGRAYIPTAYDSEQVRQSKLSRAEQLLRNYLADTSSLTEIQ